MALTYGEENVHEKLEELANALVAEGKGILCADETVSTFSHMFQPIQVENTEEMRRSYRELLFSSPHISWYISGVLLSEEALRQKTNFGVPFVELLAEQGILPGVTLDKGAVRLTYGDDEWVWTGTDELSSRCADFRRAGCRFTRWRCALVVDGELRPTTRALETNLPIVARYAAVAQENLLVPVVEATLITQRSHFAVDRAVGVLRLVLSSLFLQLHKYGVHLPGTVLRVSFASPGDSCPVSYSSEDIAQATYQALINTVPPAVSGITFCSGNMKMEEATTVLDHINRIQGRKPWPLTFCFSRPLQAGVLLEWLGLEDRKERSQRELWRRAKENSQATYGVYLKNKEVSEAAYNDKIENKEIEP